MKKIEIYNYDTNETFAIVETHNKNTEKEIIKFLENKNFNLLPKGTLFPVRDLYWLAYNKETKETINLKYRECEKELNKKDIEMDISDSI